VTYLLDTNVISELRKAGDGKADINVTNWIEAHDAIEFFISVITLFELETGVLRIERRDRQQGARLRAWLDERVRKEFQGRILPIDETVAIRCARLHVPDRRNEADALIAATALVFNLDVVTRNVRDFEGTGVVAINPWQD
jgi:predicted nucleic acid-binding protein